MEHFDVIDDSGTAVAVRDPEAARNQGVLPQLQPWKMPKGVRRSIAWAGAIGGTAAITWAIVHRVNQNVANTTVTHDPAPYLQQAQALYELCFNGDNDNSATAAINACNQTPSAPQNGTVCDWKQTWSWADRIQEPCLMAMVPGLQAEALSHAKQDARNKLAVLVLLPIVFGLLYRLTSFTVNKSTSFVVNRVRNANP